MNVCRPDGDGCQHAQRHPSDAKQGSKRSLERMGLDQGDNERGWYNHLETVRGNTGTQARREGMTLSRVIRAGNGTLHKLVVSFTPIRTFVRLA